MKARLAVIAIVITTIISGCSKNNGCKDGDCEKDVLINKNLYDNTVTNNYVITEASINGDCLEVKFGASGCDSKSWVVELVDAGQVTDSAVPQRSVKLALTNNELCAAAFGKTVSFNLKDLRVKGSHKISISLSGVNNPIIYNY